MAKCIGRFTPEMLDELRAGGTPHMPISEQLLVSLMGLATVFLCLIVLALAIMLVSKLIGGLGIGEKKAAAARCCCSRPPQWTKRAWQLLWLLCARRLACPLTRSASRTFRNLK